MTSLPRTPDSQLWLPDAAPYGVVPGLRGDRLPEAIHIADSSPVTGSKFAWGRGVEGFTCDPRVDTYDERYLAQVLSGTPLLATDACLDVTSEDTSQYGEDPSRDNQIEEHGFPVAEPGYPPGVAENSVAPRLPQTELPSAIHCATAHGFSAVQKDSFEVSSGTNLIPTAHVTFNSQERRRLRGRSAVKPKAKPKPKLKPVTEFVCGECTSARGSIVSFNCQKDLRRHKATTKAHGARLVLKCSCGKGVTRKDAMRLHHRWCKGHTL